MGIINKKHKFLFLRYCWRNNPIAMGLAKSIKLRKEKSKVWVFIGDMTFETGVFHECYKYSKKPQSTNKICYRR